MPRDLKEPEGCRSSSLRKTHPAARESAVDSMSGVRFHGLADGVRQTVGGEEEASAVAHSVSAIDPISSQCLQQGQSCS